METTEKIKVYIEFEGGKTTCICKRRKGKKPCNPKCEPDVVERDKYRGWQETMKQNRYGR